MKTLIILVLVMLLTCSALYCQTPIDPPSITSQNAMLKSHPTIFPDTISFSDTAIFNGTQSEFMFGYQWANSVAGVNSRLYMNCYNTNRAGLLDTANDLFYAYPRSYGKRTYISYDIKDAINRCFSLQFDPEAPTAGLNDYFEPSSSDTLGAIYGFGYKSGGRRGDSTNTNRYVYTADSGVAVTGRLILSNPIGSEAMQRTDNTDTQLNGTRWYLSINLRRLNNTWDADTTMSDTVLSIKLPFKYFDHTDSLNHKVFVDGVIKFDSMSSPIGLIGKGYYQRGRWMDNYLPAKNDSVFIIRRSMLPKFSDTCDITLSAYFTVADPNDANVSPKKNPPFRLIFGDIGEIDSMGMEVRYYGKCDIAIDWIRLETPLTRALFRGDRDSAIAAVVSQAFTHMRTFRTTTGGMPNARLWRFYVTDEPGALLIGGFRYLSSLFEGYSTTEGGSTNRFVHLAAKQKSYWGSVPHFESTTKVPFFKYVLMGKGSYSTYKTPRDHTFGFKGGWQYLWNPIDTATMSPSLITDILNNNFTTATCDSNREGSAYETNTFYSESWRIKTCVYPKFYPWVSSMNGFSFVSSDSFFTENVAYDVLLQDAGILGVQERDYISTKKHGDATMFSDKPWLSNIWVASEWNGYLLPNSGLKPFLRHAYLRPHTGEEIRANIWCALLLGAKGLMYDLFDNERSDTLDSGKLYDTTNYNNITRNSTEKWLRMGLMGRYDGISNNIIRNDTSGNFLLENNNCGSDYLIHGESTRIDQYIDFDSSAYALGVSPNRLYVGRKSMRLEIRNIHDRINAISDTLMQLRLRGWYAKGYRSYLTTLNEDSSYITKFLRPDSGYLKTRPIYRTGIEGWDSTFCDLTVHKYNNVSMDSMFVVGVLNRRANPLIRPLGDTALRFYTTFEFDSLTLGSDSLWRAQRYNQGGSREITIPFNYHDTLGRYAMLHVKELGGGIDTIIGQDSPLAVKFLPGEGKMFNVEILHPDAGVAGRLQYSNQRKMVGYPILRPDGTPSDSVYYHLTYHRYDPIAARNSVYYRRSNAVWYNSSSENVTWQTEKRLSQFIRASKCDGDTIMRLDCAYPSLIVRYDSADSINKVYVVYSCVAPFIADSCNPSGKQLIAENILKADADDSTYIADTAQVFNTYRGIMSEYGNPMVNASAYGNYYCWSDSTVGIVVGWKPTHARTLTDSKPLSWGAANGGQTLGCKHPSMNSYSRIGLEESDCALVWEEKINVAVPYIGTVPRSHIFYTRLHTIGDTAIGNFLSPNFFSPDASVSKSNDGKIARMSSGINVADNHTFPSVYRDLVDSVLSSSSISEQRDARTDCLLWATYEHRPVPPGIYYLNDDKYVLYRRTAWINDTSDVPLMWGVGSLCRIWSGSSYANLLNPSLSQGISLIDSNGSYTVNKSDSAVIVTMNEYPTLWVTGSPVPQYVWHIRGNVNYLYTSQDTSVWGYKNDGVADLVTDNGEYGQTAAFPVVSGSYSWRKNRRIYQTDTASPHLQMSPRYFLKASENDEQIGFTGFSDEESKYMLSNPMLSGRVLKFNRLRQDQLSNEKRVRYYDRISTDWFTIGETESLWLKSIGKNAGLVMAFVERRNDGARFPVQLGTSDDTTALWTQIHLRRGGTEEYRFFILKRLTDENNRAIVASGYSEEMALHGVKTTISSQKMGANGIQEIDLGRDVNVGASIRVYPNPAREKVTVVVTDTNQKNTWHVKVMNVLGTILSENDSKPNTSIEIVTEDYPTGIYYITAESEKMSTRTRFVIMR